MFHAWQLRIKQLKFLHWESMDVYDFSIVRDRKLFWNKYWFENRFQFNLLTCYSKSNIHRLVVVIIVVNPEVMQWFHAVDTDRTGKISAQELQQALTNANWSHFNAETCRLMIGRRFIFSDRSRILYKCKSRIRDANSHIHVIILKKCRPNRESCQQCACVVHELMFLFRGSHVWT